MGYNETILLLLANGAHKEEILDKVYRNIKGQSYHITDSSVNIKAMGKNISFKRNEISSVELMSSIFNNLPLIQKTVRIKLKSGKKYDLKAIGSKDAKEIYKELTN